MFLIKLNWFAHLLGVTALHLVSSSWSTKKMWLPRLPHSTVFLLCTDTNWTNGWQQPWFVFAAVLGSASFSPLFCTFPQSIRVLRFYSPFSRVRDWQGFVYFPDCRASWLMPIMNPSGLRKVPIQILTTMDGERMGLKYAMVSSARQNSQPSLTKHFLACLYEHSLTWMF